jgi:hypothetical protein
MNDAYKELLRQYFQAKDAFQPIKIATIERKLREIVKDERSSQSSSPLHASGY